MLDACTQNPALLILAFIGSITLFIIGLIVWFFSEKPKPQENKRARKKQEMRKTKLRKIITDVQISGQGNFNLLSDIISEIRSLIVLEYVSNFRENVKNGVEIYDNYFQRLRNVGITEEEIYPALKIILQGTLDDIEKWEKVKARQG